MRSPFRRPTVRPGVILKRTFISYKKLQHAVHGILLSPWYEGGNIQLDTRAFSRQPHCPIASRVQGLVTTESSFPNVPTRRFLDAWPSLIAKQGDPFRPLEPEIRVVQFGRTLTESQLSR